MVVSLILLLFWLMSMKCFCVYVVKCLWLVVLFNRFVLLWNSLVVVCLVLCRRNWCIILMLLVCGLKRICVIDFLSWCVEVVKVDSSMSDENRVVLKWCWFICCFFWFLVWFWCFVWCCGWLCFFDLGIWMFWCVMGWCVVGSGCFWCWCLLFFSWGWWLFGLVCGWWWWVFWCVLSVDVRFWWECCSVWCVCCCRLVWEGLVLLGCCGCWIWVCSSCGFFWLYVWVFCVFMVWDFWGMIGSCCVFCWWWWSGCFCCRSCGCLDFVWFRLVCFCDCVWWWLMVVCYLLFFCVVGCSWCLGFWCWDVVFRCDWCWCWCGWLCRISCVRISLDWCWRFFLWCGRSLWEWGVWIFSGESIFGMWSWRVFVWGLFCVGLLELLLVWCRCLG